MTEQEFDQQLWRRYDSVTLDNGLKAIISNVSFSTRSVRIYAKDLPGEWYSCDRIESHRSQKGNDASEDAYIIEELQKTVHRLQKRIKVLEKNQATASRLEAIRESVATISVQLTEKQKRADCIDSCLGRIEKFLDIVEKEKED